MRFVVELDEDIDRDDVDNLARAIEDRLGDLGVGAQARWEERDGAQRAD